MVLTKHIYSTEEKHKKPKDKHEKPLKTKPNETKLTLFSRLLRHPASKQTTTPGACIGWIAFKPACVCVCVCVRKFHINWLCVS